MLAAKSANTGKIRVTNSPGTRGLLLACDGILGCRPQPGQKPVAENGNRI